MRNVSQNRLNPVKIFCYVSMTILGSKIVAVRDIGQFLINPANFSHSFSIQLYLSFHVKKYLKLERNIQRLLFVRMISPFNVVLNVSSSKPLQILADC